MPLYNAVVHTDGPHGGKVTAILTVWILVSVPHPGKIDTQSQQYIGVYATQASCEHMLAALSDPAYELPNTKPKFMICLAQQPK